MLHRPSFRMRRPLISAKSKWLLSYEIERDWYEAEVKASSKKEAIEMLWDVINGKLRSGGAEEIGEGRWLASFTYEGNIYDVEVDAETKEDALMEGSGELAYEAVQSCQAEKI